MSPFLTPLILEPLPHRRWLVVSEFRVATEALDLITVPSGFQTDLNSLPRIWWTISPATDYPEASVVHDYLYAIQAPKASADLVYRELLAALGMSRLRRNARYWALVAFGGPAYASHKPGAGSA